MPIVREKPTVELVKVTAEMKSFNAYSKLRAERTHVHHLGARLKREKQGSCMRISIKTI